MVLLQPNDFIESPFVTREDVQQGLEGLLDPLAAHTSPGGAGIDFGSSAAHYDVRAVRLEAFARPLWGLASLLASGGNYSDPHGDEYWGAAKAKDQRMVEMSPLSYAILVAPEVFYDPQSPEAKANIAQFLASCLTQPMPDTNWLWFRVFANLALRRVGASAFDSDRLAADLARLDSFQLSPHPPIGDDTLGSAGWSRDGPPDVRQLDYYSSSFAIQVAQMVYAKVCAADDPERARAYTRRAQDFALDFVYYFSDDGACIPFGRSMVYRFAVVAMFSAMAACDISPPAPLTWGHMKGFVLRHLRSWRTPNIFRSDGTLNLGYAYDNMYATENYNAPGSPYWCCKAFMCLAADASHPFWTSDELPWPSTLLPSIKALPDPGHIMVRSGGHAFLLSSGQTAHYAMRNGNAKYGKFAYSSEFGFCYSTGVLDLEQVAGDSMLCVRDAGDREDVWRVRRGGEEARIVGRGTDEVHLRSTWNPYPDTQIETWLVPPNPASPNFYVRVYRVRTDRRLHTADAGWATYGQGADGRALVQAFSGETSPGGLEGSGAARATTAGGSVGVIDIKVPGVKETPAPRSGRLVQSDPNSNAIFSRSILPTLTADLEPGEHWVATAVFGVPPSGADSADAEWERVPTVPAFIFSS